MATFAIDLHGGDYGPSVTLPASLSFFRNFPQHKGILVGDVDPIKSTQLARVKNVALMPARALGAVAEKPSRLLRASNNSSIEMCFKLVAEQEADAVVSAEHTGALLTLMTKFARLHPLLSRPALASWLPTAKHQTVMLDLGASFTATSEQLMSFAAIGAGLFRTQRYRPSLGLLNVGSEDFKGPPEVRAADRMLKRWDAVRYGGFVEASKAFSGEFDILVCDGFTGNSIIKSAEGAMHLALNAMQADYKDGVFFKWFARWLRSIALSKLAHLDPSLANGALVAGSNLLAVKSHGNANGKAFYCALEKTALLARMAVVPAIWAQLDRLEDEDYF